MSRICELTGKRPLKGNNVSHANNKTKRRFLVNLHKKRYYSPGLKRYVTLRLSKKGQRIIDRDGVDTFLQQYKGLKVEMSEE